MQRYAPLVPNGGTLNKKVKKMIKLAIFDLDGTLLNTIADLGNACNHALRMCGFPERKAEEYNMLVGRGIYNLFRGALPENARSEENVMRMKEHFIPYYDEHKCDLTRPYGGIPEMLDRIGKSGVMLAVASNKYQDGTEKLVSEYFAGCSFVKVIGQRDGMPIKPDPGIIREIQAAAGNVSDEETVYIGDSDVDMQTGTNAGVRTIGVSWGFRTEEELSAYSPYAICHTPAEVAFVIEGLQQDSDDKNNKR